MFNLIPIQFRLFAIAIAVLVIFMAGWNVNGWRWEGKVSAMQTAWANAAIKASEEARAKEKQLSSAISELDAKHTAERNAKDEETNSLRAAVDAGSRRLRLAATCPANGLPGAAASSGVDYGAGPTLTADARQAYFDLRAGLTRMGAKLAACQDILHNERKH